ncbi:MAG: hypothetical protein ACE5IY_20725, partial [bacterium]
YECFTLLLLTTGVRRRNRSGSALTQKTNLSNLRQTRQKQAAVEVGLHALVMARCLTRRTPTCCPEPTLSASSPAHAHPLRRGRGPTGVGLWGSGAGWGQGDRSRPPHRCFFP